MGVSVGDFAEQLLAEEQQNAAKGIGNTSYEANPSLYAATDDAPQVDISNVEVPNDFIKSIVEGVEEAVVTKPKQTTDGSATGNLIGEAPEPMLSTEVTEVRTLLEEIKGVLAEVNKTLLEVTTCGALGVNLAGPKKKNRQEEEDEDELDEDEGAAMKNVLKKMRARRASK